MNADTIRRLGRVAVLMGGTSSERAVSWPRIAANAAGSVASAS